MLWLDLHENKTFLAEMYEFSKCKINFEKNNYCWE